MSWSKNIAYVARNEVEICACVLFSEIYQVVQRGHASDVTPLLNQIRLGSRLIQHEQAPVQLSLHTPSNPFKPVPS